MLRAVPDVAYLKKYVWRNTQLLIQAIDLAHRRPKIRGQRLKDSTLSKMYRDSRSANPKEAAISGLGVEDFERHSRAPR